MSIKGSPIIENFDGGKDSRYRDFGFRVNDGAIMQADEAESILFDANNSEAREALSTFGFLNMVVDPRSDLDKKFKRWMVNNPRAKAAHTHEDEDCAAFALMASAGVSRSINTVLLGRRHVADILGDENLFDDEYLNDGLRVSRQQIDLILGHEALYSVDGRAVNATPFGLLTKHMFNSILDQLGAINFCKFIDTFMGRIPKNAKWEQEWDQQIEYDRILIFDSRYPMHALGNPPHSWCDVNDPNMFETPLGTIKIK